MNEKWSMVIKPHEKLWRIDFKEIWRYRDLISLFVKRNIIVQYKQTILGPLWFLIQPILTVIMNMVVFGGIAKMSTDGIPQPLFYLAGNVCWFYFSDCLNQTYQANAFINNHIAKKLKLDKERIPWTIQKYGNTSSVSVPLTIVSELKDKMQGEKKLMLSAFGVGMAWATAIVPFVDCKISDIIEI